MKSLLGERKSVHDAKLKYKQQQGSSQFEFQGFTSGRVCMSGGQVRKGDLSA